MDDLLFNVENISGYLGNAVATMQLLTEGLDHAMRVAENAKESFSHKWALQYCSGFFVVTRELERCAEVLDKVISQAFQDNVR